MHPTVVGQHVSNDPLNFEVSELSKFYCGPDPQLHATKEAVAELTGVPAANVEAGLTLFTNTLCHLSRATHFTIADILANSQAELLMFIDLARYDETPMKVAYNVTEPDADLGAGPGGAQEEMPMGLERHPTRPNAQLLRPSKSTALSKMFSTESKHVMIVKLPVEGARQLEEKLFVLCCSSLTWNQLLSKATGPVLTRALAETADIAQAHLDYGMKVRVATTDQASANIAAEQKIAEERDPTWCNLHLFCNVHHCARLHSKSLAFLEGPYQPVTQPQRRQLLDGLPEVPQTSDQEGAFEHSERSAAPGGDRLPDTHPRVVLPVWQLAVPSASFSCRTSATATGARQTAWKSTSRQPWSSMPTRSGGTWSEPFFSALHTRSTLSTPGTVGSVASRQPTRLDSCSPSTDWVPQPTSTCARSFEGKQWLRPPDLF